MTYLQQIAQAGYEGYCTFTGWKSAVTKAPLPPWKQLPDTVQNAWIAAAQSMLNPNLLDNGNFADGLLYFKLDALYERGWVDNHKKCHYDPRGTTQWQSVLDLFKLYTMATDMKVENAWTKTQLVEFLRDVACDIELGTYTQGSIMFSVNSDTGDCGIIYIVGDNSQNEICLREEANG